MRNKKREPPSSRSLIELFLIMTEEFDRLLAATNDRLRKSRAGIALELRGVSRSLYLRGTFPPKPGNRKTKDYQQRIALKQKATPETIRQAEATAKLVGAELNLGRFDWGKWSDAEEVDAGTVGYWLEKFEADYWNRRGKSPAVRTTWRCDYQFDFKKLDNALPLTIALLTESLLETPPASRARKRRSIALGALAKFAGLDAEPLRRLRGKYSGKEVGERNLPTDAAIIQWHDWMVEHHPQWAWIYGMMATYGLRPHEVFKIEDWSQFPVIRVKDSTKTGARPAVPLRPEWAENWKLNAIVMPRITIDGTEGNQKLGGKISRAFYLREELPFVAYDLRHCWARRSVEFGLTPDVAAKLMGHTVKIHLETYRRWIGEEVYVDAYKKAIERFNDRRSE